MVCQLCADKKVTYQSVKSFFPPTTQLSSPENDEIIIVETGLSPKICLGLTHDLAALYLSARRDAVHLSTTDKDYMHLLAIQISTMTNRDGILINTEQALGVCFKQYRHTMFSDDLFMLTRSCFQRFLCFTRCMNVIISERNVDNVAMQNKAKPYTLEEINNIYDHHGFTNVVEPCLYF